jgi:hypothetical protein
MCITYGIIKYFKQNMFYRVEKGRNIHLTEDAGEADLVTGNGEDTPPEIDIDTNERGEGVAVGTGIANGATGVDQGIEAGRLTNTGKLSYKHGKVKLITL